VATLAENDEVKPSITSFERSVSSSPLLRFFFSLWFLYSYSVAFHSFDRGVSTDEFMSRSRRRRKKKNRLREILCCLSIHPTSRIGRFTLYLKDHHQRVEDTGGSLRQSRRKLGLPLDDDSLERVPSGDPLLQFGRCS